MELQRKPKTDKAERCRRRAEAYFSRGELVNAYMEYCWSLKWDPDSKNALKKKVLVLLSCMGKELERVGRPSDVIRTYKPMMEFYSNCPEFFSNVGIHLRRMNYAHLSITYFKQALRRDIFCLSAYRNLFASFCAVVPRRYYRALNDSCRNEAFMKVISAKVAQGFDTVLDIGTGTGLLCLYAHWAGAKKVYACEPNVVLTSVTAEILKKHQLTAKVKLFNKSVNNLKVPDDIPERVSLVITGAFDACFLDKKILSSLNYAWTYLLKPPYPYLYPSKLNATTINASEIGVVVPSSGAVWLKLFESPILAKRYMFPLTETYHKTDMRGVDLSNVAVRASRYCQSPDTQRLQNQPDCVFLTDVYHLFGIDFNDPAQIARQLRDDSRLLVHMPCIYAGYVHGIGAWFSMRLYENYCLSSAPDSPDAKNCQWDQLVFPSNRAYRVFPGSRVTVACDWKNGKFALEIIQILHPNGTSVPADAEFLSPSTVPVECVMLLNDAVLSMHLGQAADRYVNELRARAETDAPKILDLYPVPIFGLAVLRSYLAATGMLPENAQLVCVGQSPAEEQVIKSIAVSNLLPLTCLSFVTADDFTDVLREGRWQRRFDAILVNFFHYEGVLDEVAISRIDSFKSLLKPDGILLPKRIEITGQLIHSDRIEKALRVINPEMKACGIADLLHNFEIPQLVGMNAESLLYEKYSNPFVCHAFSIDKLKLEFFERYVKVAIRSGTLTSILCWFQMSIFDDYSNYSTLHPMSYAHQTVFLGNSPVAVCMDDNIFIDMLYRVGGFIIKIKEDDGSMPKK